MAKKIHECNKEEEITEIRENISAMNVKINDMHKAIMGNGREGMITKIAKVEGVIGFGKWIVGLIGIGGLASFIMHFI